MFHVKHPAAENIAAEVRSRIEQFLRHAAPFTPRPGFIDKIGAFAACLALWGANMNLTAEPENPDEVAFHVIDSLTPLILAARESSPLAGAFTPGVRVLDLGSGAGFPGLILTAASQARFTLVEARRKRASFLKTAMHEMGLANVEIDSAHREIEDFTPDFDIVTARAFGRASEFYPIASNALRPGGRAILYANPEQRLDLHRAEAVRLSDYERIAYELGRGGSLIQRILAIWRKR